MKLILFEDAAFQHFYPLTYVRPAFDLRCGHTTLREKIERAFAQPADAVFVREWLREAYASRDTATVNSLDALKGDDLVLINGRALWLGGKPLAAGRDARGMAGDDIAYLTLTRATADKITARDFDGFLAEAAKVAQAEDTGVELLRYPWDIIEHNAAAIRNDFEQLGTSGVEGTLSPLSTVWGPEDRVYIAPGAVVEPCVVIDTQEGPVIIDEGVVVNPHTRIQGPAAIGRDTMLFGGKIREGTTIGPMCRVGGEVEEAVIHGYSNKYHDGFLGHAYVCPWVNLGALTTNSDLKNDYGTVEVNVRGQLLDTGSTKVGCFIGDYTKTSIGTLMNTGTMIGMMANILGAGCLLPKVVPSFVMFMDNRFFKAGIKQLISTARTAMGRRKVELAAPEEALLRFLFTHLREERSDLIRASRRDLLAQKGLSI